jgi:hypothetical protein
MRQDDLTAAIVYTERVGGSNSSPPTSVRSLREIRLGQPSAEVCEARKADC